MHASYNLLARRTIDPRCNRRLLHRAHLGRSCGSGRAIRRPRVAARWGRCDGYRYLVDALHRHVGLLGTYPSALQHSHDAALADRCYLDLWLRARDWRSSRSGSQAPGPKLASDGRWDLRHALHRHGGHSNHADDQLRPAARRRLDCDRDHSILLRRPMARVWAARRAVVGDDPRARCRRRRDGIGDHGHALHGQRLPRCWHRMPIVGVARRWTTIGWR